MKRFFAIMLSLTMLWSIASAGDLRLKFTYNDEPTSVLDGKTVTFETYSGVVDGDELFIPIGSTLTDVFALPDDVNYYIVGSNQYTTTDSDVYSEVAIDDCFTLKGKVTDFINGAYVEGATVSVFALSADEQTYSTCSPVPYKISNNVTDASGNYTLRLAEGRYKLEVYKAGRALYKTIEDSSFTNDSGHTTIVLNKENPLFEANITMTPDTPFEIDYFNPHDGQISVNFTTWRAVFNKPVLASSITSETVRIYKQNGANVGGSAPRVYDNDPCAVDFVATDAQSGQTYTYFFSKDLMATDGTKLGVDVSSTFTMVRNVAGGDSSSGGSGSLGGSPVGTPLSAASPLSTGVKMTDTEEHWAKTFIEKLIEQKVISGYLQDDGSYCFLPENNITRQEIAKLVVLANKLEVPQEVATLPFADSDLIDSWAVPFVSAAYNNGLIKGIIAEEGEVNFNPYGYVTRAEIITILGRGFSEQGGDPVQFVDRHDIPDWAIPYVSVLYDKGIISGYQEGDALYLRPLNNITRAEAATMIAKYMD